MPQKEHSYHTTGKFCHKVLEDFHNAYIDGSSKPLNIEMGQAWKNALAEFGEKMTPDMRKDCWDIINQYLKIVTEDKKNNRFANVIACEKNFSFNISENVILNGMIDRIQVDDDGIFLIADYKTTKNKRYLKEDWFQLLTYALVMLEEDPSITKIRGSYILLRHNFEYITKEFSLDEILAVKQKYIEYAEKIRSEKDYAPTTSFLCSYCSHLEHCEAGRAVANPVKVFGEVQW